MNKKALYDLLGKYLNNDCTAEERKLIDNWLEILQENKSFAAYTKADLDSIHNRIWAKIQEKTIQQEETEKPIPSSSLVIRFARWAVAASVAGLLIFAGLRFANTKPSTAPGGYALVVPTANMVVKTNATNASLKLILEDSTAVVLEPGTTLNYPAHFLPGKREVYLDGTAFFEVTKNAKRPFFIYHNNLVTHVLGTSFIINTKRQNKEVEVSVITGRVEVSEASDFVKTQSDKKANGVILTPNQKVTYAVDGRLFVSSLVDKPLPLKKKAPESFDFDNVEIGQVLSAISSEYAIDIVTENDNIGKCTFTGNIAKQDLYTKLDILCKATNSSYEIKGTQVLIKGNGCE